MNDLPHIIEHISCVPARLDLDRTLSSGQVFRWIRDDAGIWSACLEPGGIVVHLRQTQTSIDVDSKSTGVAALLERYFRLDEPLDDWLGEWQRSGGPEICAAIAAYPGLRVVRQDPWECLISFLASPAAPIYRIRRSMLRLAARIGEPCASEHGQLFCRFPAPEALAATQRVVCDECGLGFRGPNLIAAASMVLDRGGRGWLEDLRTADYADAKRELVRLPGVGDKIADCVCLFSLDKDEAVPIDVHIARVARTLFEGLPASVTPKTYIPIADRFRERFGSKAGWAQQYLFFSQIDTS
ncbi:MAG: DNA glycosylase [Capsulimonadaceae bacterium]|nr:DNA glycosylase [Capsulimonadaceae bacterium]